MIMFPTNKVAALNEAVVHLYVRLFLSDAPTSKTVLVRAIIIIEH